MSSPSSGPSPDEHGIWITAPQWKADPDGPLPVMSRVIQVTGTASDAHLSIAGLGVYQVEINRDPVTEDVLEPGYTDYRIRTEWRAHDVTKLLQEGRNVITIALGPGCYRSAPLRERWTKINTDFGDLGCCATLSWTDGQGDHVVATDGEWGAALGPVRGANWVGGEDYDAAHVVDPTAAETLARAVPADVPTGIALTPKTIPPLRVREELAAVEIRTVAPGRHVVDFGINAAGWMELDLPPHADVKVSPAELCHPDGTIDGRTQGWAPVYHRVRSAGEPLRWHPQFMYNGFRFIEIDGLPDAPSLDQVRCKVIAAAAEPAGSFACSDHRLTDLHRIIHRAITSNMFSMFTDCPQREKLGYLEQLHLTLDSLAWSYDVEDLLINTLRITREAQGDDGHLGLYVPEWDPFPDPWRGDVNFGVALAVLPWQLYRAYGNANVLTDNVDAAGRWFSHVLDTRIDGLVEYGLGDWDGRKPRHVPLVATSTLARGCDALELSLRALGDDHAADRWSEQAAELRTVVAKRFVHSDGQVGDGTVSEQAIGLWNGVVPDDLVVAATEHLTKTVIADDFDLDIGEIAMTALVEVLGTADRHDLLHEIVTQDRHPGYGYQLKHGATSLTETLDGADSGISQNHFIYAAIDHWLLHDVLGISQSPGSMGWREVIIRPRATAGLTHASGSRVTPQGSIQVSWHLDGDTFTLDVSVPEATRAIIHLPDGSRRRLDGGHLTAHVP